MQPKKIFSIFNKSISIENAIVLGILLVCISPFFIVSIFNNPSIDDFVFPDKVFTLGLFHSQIDWYLHWTGRYFSTFLLSIGPLTFHSITGYKIESTILILLFIHATYIVVSRLLGEQLSEFKKLFLALLFFIVYIMYAPSVVQGFYWLSGAFTYQLGNICLLYLIGIVLKYGQGNASKTTKFIGVLLVILSPGLNENSLVLQNGFLGIVFLNYLFRTKKINRFLLSLLLLSIVFSCVEVLAPGNYVRAAIMKDPNQYNFSYAFPLAIENSVAIIYNFVISLPFLIISFLCVMVFTNKKYNLPDIITGKLYVTIPLCFLLFFTSVFINYFITTIPPPDRVLNVSIFIFLASFYYNIILIGKQLNGITKKLHYPVLYRILKYLLISLFICAVLTTKNNIKTCFVDVFSGKAYEYNQNCLERYKILNNTEEGKEARLYTCTAFPKTILFRDLDNDFFTSLFGQYFNKVASVVSYRPPHFAEKYFYSFENDTRKQFTDTHTLSYEKAFNGMYSSKFKGNDSCSIVFCKKIWELSSYNYTNITNLNAQIKLFVPDSVFDAVLVISIVNSKGEAILWTGKSITNKEYKSNTWNDITSICSITESRFSQPSYEIRILVWNRSSATMYMDNMEVKIY